MRVSRYPRGTCLAPGRWPTEYSSVSRTSTIATPLFTSSWTSEGSTSLICSLMRRVYSAPLTLIRESPEYRSGSRLTSESIAPGSRAVVASGAFFAGRAIDLEPYARAPVRAAPAVGERVDEEEAAAAGIVGIGTCRDRREPRAVVGDLDPHAAGRERNVEADPVVLAAVAMDHAVRDDLAGEQARGVRDGRLEAARREPLDRRPRHRRRVCAAGQAQVQRALAPERAGAREALAAGRRQTGPRRAQHEHGDVVARLGGADDCLLHPLAGRDRV